MPRGGANRKPTAAKQRYFELLRQGLKGLRPAAKWAYPPAADRSGSSKLEG
ncbi:hypothetical protein [Streptomyces malaysiensis]|uniref:hypothetical protein n=1 Tax=Streptomyces malaysiensis TaxID=92644 RepID=UPI002B2F1F8B|nr:hypothetical protein R8789_13250 [Streptomyces malaysiensis]